MKFLKSLLCKCLCINNLYKINNNGVDVFKRTYPNKYISFKKTKELYYSNKIYYDFYNNYYNDYYYFNNNYELYPYLDNIKLTAEHIFPQSYTKLYPKAKFDMHNLYLTSGKTNTNRSNYKYVDEIYYFHKSIFNYYYFDYQKNKKIKYNKYQNYKNSKLKLCIPSHNSRGVISRSLAYMKYTYSDIILENVIDIDTMLKWNKQYPPTYIEIKHNNVVKSIQGNDNIFIVNKTYMEFYFKNI